MTLAPQRADFPPPGGLAWLDMTDPRGRAPRPRTGPLGLTITPLSRRPREFVFRGARLRGARCTWSASTVAAAELTRASRVAVSHADDTVHLLARLDAPGTVFEPAGPPVRAVMRVYDSVVEICELFPTTTHLFTLNVPRSAAAIEAGSAMDLADQTFDLTPFQIELLRSSVAPLLAGAGELTTPPTIAALDRYLAALAGMLIRSISSAHGVDFEQVESVRARADAIIAEQVADQDLTPASIAAQLNISLRQLYRAFDGAESPAARIRRRRLERAARLLADQPPHTHVDRVAQDCGFGSAEYFSRAFRREFGLSPRAYRSAHRELPVSR